MDLPLRKLPQIGREIGVWAVRRRHVIYVAGYEPRGARGYYRLLERECGRFQRVWPVSLTVKPVDLDSQDFARWLVAVRASNWRVLTTYDFLRFDNFIQSDLAEPLIRHILRSLGWIVGDLVSGAQFRIFRASWRFGLHLLFVQSVLLAWLALAAAIGLRVGYVVTHHLDLSTPASIVTALLAVLACLVALQPVARRCGAIQIPSCWVILRRFACGRATWLDQVVDTGAQRLVAAARANDADEIVVVGHSAGCAIASAMIARALEYDPELGRRGPRLVLLTLGSVMPAVALHPAAQRMREITARLAVEPALAWIDCAFRKDVMAFINFDPVEGVGVRVGARRCNPLTWRVPFKEMLSPQNYRRLKWKFFRVHFQYIMASDRPCPYDYILLIGGPVAIAEWAKKHWELTLSFIRDGMRDGRGPAASLSSRAHNSPQQTGEGMVENLPGAAPLAAQEAGGKRARPEEGADR
jgi:pimeloyl-ACP methyl ester carboxylesterase